MCLGCYGGLCFESAASGIPTAYFNILLSSDNRSSAAYSVKPPHLKKIAMFLNSGDADMYDGAMFSFEGDFLGYLGLENMGVFTAHGSENGSAKKLDELRKFGASLKS